MSDILRPYVSLGRQITREDIRRTLDAIANVPPRFETRQLADAILPMNSDATGVERMEALNKLMQRLRRAGLASFAQKKWHIDSAAWQEIQSAMYATTGEKTC